MPAYPSINPAHFFPVEYACPICFFTWWIAFRKLDSRYNMFPLLYYNKVVTKGWMYRAADPMVVAAW